MRGAIDFETYGWRGEPDSEGRWETGVHPLSCALVWPGERGEYDDDWVHRRADGDWVGEESLRRAWLLSRDCGVDEWWAHNGGCFDALFLSAAAVRLGWEQEGVVNGTGRLLEWKARPRGEEVWAVFCDSFAIVPSSLASAARDFELPSRKLFDAADYRGDMRDLPVGKLREGNLADCRVVLELLDKVEGFVTEWGGKLKLTFSSSALSVLRARETLPKFDAPDAAHANQTAQQAKYGGRIEVHHHLPRELLTEYDRNSSYPAAMCGELPWAYIGKSATPRDASKYLKRGVTGVYRARVSIPRSARVPPLPYRLPCRACGLRSVGDCAHDADERPPGVFFPTGEWEAWFSGNELRYAMEECGVGVSPLEGLFYSTHVGLESFVREVYELKQTANGALRAFAKYMLNGCYGKFGQRPECENLFTVTEGNVREWLVRAVLEGRQVDIFDDEAGLVTETLRRWPKHANYALASHILAGARISLHEMMSRAKLLCYVDTDSVHARKGCLSRFVGKELGEWKVEMDDVRGRYYAPKIYRLVGKDGHPHYASKGFSILCDACARSEKPKPSCEACEARFEALVRGEGIDVARMRVIKSQAKQDARGTVRKGERKFWRGRSAKRRPLEDGSTVPWTVEELARGEHEDALSPLYGE